LKLLQKVRIELIFKRLLGDRCAGQLGLSIRPMLRILSYFPSQRIRLAILRATAARIGVDVVLEPGVRVLSPWRLLIGSHTNIGRHVHLDARGYLSIGDNVNISDEAAVWTAEHDIQSPNFVMTRARVTIENRVWVGFRSIVLPGVTLGEGCIVASGSIVTKDVPPFSVVAGVPARVIGKRTRMLTYQLGNSPKGL